MASSRFSRTRETAVKAASWAGVVPAGTGVLLNDEMDDFTIAPDVPNGYQLRSGVANRIEPRKRPLSSMTPTILTRDGQLFMVTGSPGGRTIINTVLERNRFSINKTAEQLKMTRHALRYRMQRLNINLDGDAEDEGDSKPA